MTVSTKIDMQEPINLRSGRGQITSGKPLATLELKVRLGPWSGGSQSGGVVRERTGRGSAVSMDKGRGRRARVYSASSWQCRAEARALAKVPLAS